MYYFEWNIDAHFEQKRQKPKEAPKAPEKAPFFLPTIQGLDPKFQIEKTESESDATSHIFKMGDLRTESEFSRLLALAANATEEQDEACKSNNDNMITKEIFINAF